MQRVREAHSISCTAVAMLHSELPRTVNEKVVSAEHRAKKSVEQTVEHRNGHDMAVPGSGQDKSATRLDVYNRAEHSVEQSIMSCVPQTRWP